MLDTAVLLGVVPARYGVKSKDVDLPAYFAMARGTQSLHAMEMTKWFDTNYHYIVPEFESNMEFHVASHKPVQEFLEAQALGINTRPVLLGPVSFVFLGKARENSLDRASLCDALVPVYADVLTELQAVGADWVQIDEPCLGLDLSGSDRALYRHVYEQLATRVPKLPILLATYFSGLRENLAAALHLPVAGLHLDLVRAPEQLEPALLQAPAGLLLSLGIIDGRGIWRADLDRALAAIERAIRRLGAERIQIAPSCSLLHVPIDLEQETQLDPEVRSWLAFARQKLAELSLLARASVDDSAEVTEQLRENRRVLADHRKSSRTYDPAVRQRTRSITSALFERSAEFPARRKQQPSLPLLPTTTIGSFPQSAELRKARAAHRRGTLDQAEWHALLRTEIARAIRLQQEVGLDVLVHGEFERSDMVEYFAERLQGFAFTSNGWVQSYGSRCVKPPILFGDISRPQPLTVEWSSYAQSLTTSPVKAMLTGPVTMLNWSFVRNDLPRPQIGFQLALALRDEIRDLENAGMHIIQVDEPALREGMPLHHQDGLEYLAWAVDAFRLATAGVRNGTQIQTHMCYSEFGDILPAIDRMDADVILIEAARSEMELLDAFAGFEYARDIGPGVYDIHSPRVPPAEEMENLIRKALGIFPAERLWINPDCGLKTRRWHEVAAALRNMVTAAQNVRRKLSSHPGRFASTNRAAKARDSAAREQRTIKGLIA